ncbi:MAG: CHC2 zinc finger domain-containing protein [Candidatus Sulfotelmatobacter sp.]|jgi:DNA primase
MSTWIDFRQLCASLDFVKVLAHYGVVPKIKGRQHKGFCPLPTHNGQERSPSFSVNLDKKAWQCFGCGAHGNVLDFAARMEGFDPSNSSDIRKTALRLQELFGADPSNKPAQNPAVNKAPFTRRIADDVGAKPEVPTLVNIPLDFVLKGPDAKHPYLAERGFTSQTIDHFGLGYCSRGLLKGRIAIPIHNEKGQLVGYAGPLVDESELSEENPKYKLLRRASTTASELNSANRSCSTTPTI